MKGNCFKCKNLRGEEPYELEFVDCCDYSKARRLGLTQLKRWEKGVPHHKMSERLMEFLKVHDIEDYENYFDWETGGDLVIKVRGSGPLSVSGFECSGDFSIVAGDDTGLRSQLSRMFR